MLFPKLFFVAFVCLLAATTTKATTLTQRHRQSFADEFNSILYSDKNDENHCTSSLGVSMVMSLVYPSMTQGAAKEVEDVFGYSTDNLVASSTKSTATTLSSSLQWSTATNELNSKCKDVDDCDKNGPTVVISNSVWTQEGRQLRSEYSSVVTDIQKSIDLTDTIFATKAINTWVSDATSGLIEEIVDGSPLPELFAINTIYLKATWKKPFMNFFTNRDIFYNGDGKKTTETSFMHQVEYFRHHTTANHQILELPFYNGRGDGRVTFAMYLVLPINNDNLMLSSSELVDIKNAEKLVSRRIALALPKFTVSSTYKNDVLKPILMDMGITQAFTPSMCVYEDDNCSSQVTDIIQKTFMSVDEEGMEAAAVTAMGIRATSAPTDVPTLFQADRAFQFFVYDSKTDVVLFEGVVRDPSTFQNNSGKEEKLKARHGDADFWKNNLGAMPQRAVVDVVEEKEEARTKSTSASNTTINKLSLMIASVVGFLAFLLA